MVTVTPFEDSSAAPPVRGYLHQPETSTGHAIVLTHGAGSNANAPLLIAAADAFAAAGYLVLRCDLPFRQTRPSGPPFPAAAPQDRAGLRRAVELIRARVPGSIYLGGHSYGGRQSTILIASEPDLVSGLLLFSYPLHPPGRPENLRTEHFPQILTPVLFVHGTRDPFGSPAEMETALQSIPARHELIVIDGAAHDLGGKKAAPRTASTALDGFQRFFSA